MSVKTNWLVASLSRDVLAEILYINMLALIFFIKYCDICLTQRSAIDPQQQLDVWNMAKQFGKFSQIKHWVFHYQVSASITLSTDIVVKYILILNDNIL